MIEYVWRVQNAKGKGPYGPRQYSWTLTPHDGNHGRPGPDYNTFVLVSNEPARRFGFESIESAMRWFWEPREIVSLVSLGFLLQRVPARDIVHDKSGTQLTFIPAESI